MKFLRFSILIFFVVLTMTNFISAQTYNQPESAVYDASGERWLISNYGNGDIIARANDGSLTYFNQGTSIASAGMAIVGNTLYVAGQKTDQSFAVFGFDLSTGAVMSTTIFNAFTSDVTADASGKIFVSGLDKLYQVDPTTGTVTTVFTNAGGLNGVLFDNANNRLLFTVNTATSEIWALDISSLTATKLITNTFGGLDGLTVDHNGNFYVSSYFTNEIYRYDSNFTNSVLSAEVPDGVADIHFAIGAPAKIKDAKDAAGVLAIPNLVDKVNFIPFEQLDTKEETSVPNDFQLHQNFPNPFNPSTTIFYDVSRESNVRITIFDILGREIVKLVDQIEPAGSRSINWDGRDYTGNLVNAGIYIYQIAAEGNLQTKKMVLLK